uniref:Uncharacterized protein n=1 Tax=viral metagenome TaxID=1070528 RepID=A0A6C0I2K7_9ZZZZ
MTLQFLKKYHKIFIFLTILHKKEFLGYILKRGNKYKLVYIGVGSSIMVDPVISKCYACFHTHPPRCLILPKEDIYFTPPSMADIYITILACILKKRKKSYSFVLAMEGIYKIKITKYAKLQAFNELGELLLLEDPWQFPANPIISENGLDGFNFNGKESQYPYISELLNTKISWEFYSLQNAFEFYQNSLDKLGIIVTLSY